MSGLTETKKNKSVDVYNKNSAGDSKRAVSFTPEAGIVIGAAGKGSVGFLDSNIKLHRGSSGLQFVKETDTTPDGVSAPYENLATVTKISSGEFIVGSAAQVTEGRATHSTLTSAIAAASAGNTIYILELTAPITEGVTITLSKRVNIIGKGYGSKITDNLVMSSSAANSLVSNLYFGQNVTINSGCNKVIMSDCWLSSTSVFTDSGANNLISTLKEV